MNFISIDFETANRHRASACSLALTIVKHDRIADNLYSLINPQVPFARQNTKVNGLRKQDVQNAPAFPGLWKVIRQFFTSEQLIVAHNNNFDNAVLCDSLERYGIKEPRYLTLDTLRSTRKLYPSLPNYRLETVCKALDIDLKHHHNALSDSVACAKILIHEHRQFGDSLIKPFVQVIN